MRTVTCWLVLGLLSGWLGSRLGCNLTVIGLPQTARERLQAQGQRLHDEGSLAIVQGTSNREVLACLGWAHQVVQARVSCAQENIACANVTKTADGTPYRRQFLRHDALTGSFGRVTSTEDFKWVYDPTNPGAEKSGEHAGYVCMPNVNLLQERATLAQCERELQVLEEALRQLEPGLVGRAFSLP